jgi:hypothetical protein
MKHHRFTLLAGLLLLLLASVNLATAASAYSPTQTEGWAYRRAIHIDNSSNSATLNDYQVKVMLDGTNFDFAQADGKGDDLRFTDEDGRSLLNYWVEYYDAQRQTAVVWVRVPAIPSAGSKTIYLYYGAAPHSISNGMRVFPFFDDFGVPGTGYYDLSPAQTVLTVTQAWENAAPHTLSVVEANHDGYRYWGYYGLTNCGGIGLARSNDLLHWDKYERNPLYNQGGERWPSAVKVSDTYYMVHDRDYCTNSYLVLRSSKDALDFGPPDQYTLLIPAEDGARNQNAALFYDQNSQQFYLYWYRGGAELGLWQIKVRSAATAEGLADPSSEHVLIEEPYEIAAPHMLYYDNTYYLATEVNENAWKTRVYAGPTPLGPFTELPGNPVLGDNEACFFQHVFSDTLHAYYCKDTGAGWVVNYRTADLTQGRSQERILDVSKWSLPDDHWRLVSDGSALSGNVVLSGTQTAEAVMWSSAFTGTDYIVDVSGHIVSGTAWALGVRASDDASRMYRIELRNGSEPRLSVGRWEKGDMISVASAALDGVDLTGWFTVTAKAHGNALDILVNGSPRLQVTDIQFDAGRVALIGPADTTVLFDTVLVRRYAVNEPLVALGAVEAQGESAGAWLGVMPPTATPPPLQPTGIPAIAVVTNTSANISLWLLGGAAAVVLVGGILWFVRRRP